MTADCEDVLNVRAHGVAGDGTSDDTAAIQALVDSANDTGGGTLFFPAGVYRITNLTLKSGVVLQGSQGVYGYGPGSRGSCRLVALPETTGVMIDTTGSNAGVKDMDLRGSANASGTSGATTGIRSSHNWCQFTNLHFDMFRGPALQTVGTGYADTIHTILAINCCLDRTATTDVGVMDIAGNDHWIYGVESSASLSSGVSSPNLYINAWVIRGTNNFVSNTVGEFADRGYLITGTKNRFTGIRGDRNFGMGWENRGSSNVFGTCMAVDNHRGLTTPTYPAVKTTGFGNKHSACLVTITGPDRPTACFEDTVNTSSPASRNTYDPSCDGPASVPLFKGHDYLGSSFELPNHPIRVTAGTTVPVSHSNFQVLSYGEATTVTDFTGGHSGQTITVINVNNPEITIANGSAIKTRSGVDLVIPRDKAHRFARYNGVWYEV